MSKKLLDFVTEYIATNGKADLTQLSYTERLELAESFPSIFEGRTETVQRQIFNSCGNYSVGIYK